MAANADVELAAAYGVEAAVIGSIRARLLTEEVHYRRAGGVVIYLKAGLERVADVMAHAMQKEEGGTPGADEAAAEPADGAQPSVACLIGRIEPNPIFVSVQVPPGFPESGCLVPVRVRSNKVLKKGGRLQCRRGPDGWICAHPGHNVFPIA